MSCLMVVGLGILGQFEMLRQNTAVAEILHQMIIFVIRPFVPPSTTSFSVSASLFVTSGFICQGGLLAALSLGLLREPPNQTLIKQSDRLSPVQIFITKWLISAITTGLLAIPLFSTLTIIFATGQIYIGTVLFTLASILITVIFFITLYQSLQHLISPGAALLIAGVGYLFLLWENFLFGFINQTTGPAIQHVVTNLLLPPVNRLTPYSIMTRSSALSIAWIDALFVSLWIILILLTVIVSRGISRTLETQQD